jgi:hypothetical protein
MTSASPVAKSRALLQSTIAKDANDWCISRFSLLAEQIRQAGAALDPAFALTVQDYPADGNARELLQGQLRQGYYGQVWLMAPDLDNGPDPAFFEALEASVAAGTQLVIATDHTDLGSSLLAMGGCLAPVTETQTFNRTWPGFACDNEYSNPACPGIDTPCVVTGQNGGVQICRLRSNHPLLDFKTMIPGHLVMPAHPHEGVIRPTTPSQQVLISSYSVTSGREQITAILDEVPGRGAVLHHSTFHHFADYNLNVDCGAPDFVLDPPSTQIDASPQLLDDQRAYVASVVAYGMAA